MRVVPRFCHCKFSIKKYVFDLWFNCGADACRVCYTCTTLLSCVTATSSLPTAQSRVAGCYRSRTLASTRCDCAQRRTRALETTSTFAVSEHIVGQTYFSQLLFGLLHVKQNVLLYRALTLRLTKCYVAWVGTLFTCYGNTRWSSYIVNLLIF